MKLEAPWGAADVWVNISDVDVLLQNWTAERLDIDFDQAEKLLARRWSLPQRRQRQSADAVAPVGVMPAASNVVLADGVRRNTTVGCRYLHRAVSHFYQRIGKKAVSACATFVNNQVQSGTLRRARGTHTKVFVVLSSHEAAALLTEDAFMTEFVYHQGIVRALRTVFSVPGIVQRFSEVNGPSGTTDVIALLTVQVSLVTMKIRSHLKRRAASHSDEEDLAEESPGLNAGHRTEWVKELSVNRSLFAVQGVRASNSLRLVDGTAPHRDNPTYRDAVPPGPAQTLPPAAADANPPSTAAAHGSADGEEASDGETPGPFQRAAVAAAHDAIARGVEGVYEELD